MDEQPNEPGRFRLTWIAIAIIAIAIAAAGWTQLRLREARDVVDAMEAEASELETRNMLLRDELAAAGLVARFYSTYLQEPIAGLPSGESLDRLRPFLSTRLATMIDDALAYQAQYIAEHPPKPSPRGGAPEIHKPPFVDGDHFSSMFEGPRRFEVGKSSATGRGAWEVAVRFWHDATVPGWEDRIVVVEELGKPVIDDVIYGGAGEFNPQGRLTETLQYREGAED